jgi:hypothetical protein
MTIVVTVIPSQPVVTIKANSQGALNSNAVVVAAAVGGGTGASRIRDLLDVDSSNAATNDTIVYQANTQTYIVEPLPVVDGGSF